MAREPEARLAPRVETQRLVLRGLRRDDLDAFAACLADPDTVAHMDGVVDRRNAWRILASGVGTWVLDGAGWWAVARRDDDAIIGTVGAFFRETCDELEIGWMTFSAHRGQGYASEAAAAALACGFELHPVDRAIAHIAAENTPSIRVAEHIGMRHDGEVSFYGSPCQRYVIER